ncbi:DUF2786 domain-containing protein [Terrabacter sp. NPDC000476]|uniref:DUF2786 domain-containing protein n=1 Tax=Terrabacter sp. NPDC000476 TaxID=3154258 RepID=UPI0033250576
MGKASRERRRAAQDRSGAPRPDEPGAPDAARDDELRTALQLLLDEGVYAIDRADTRDLDDTISTVATLCSSGTTSRVVVRGLVDALARATTRAWELGWQPADVHRLAGRRLGSEEQQIAVDVMASELARYAPATVDRQWLAQLRELDDAAPRSPSVTWLEARRAGGLDWFTLVERALAVLHLLVRLPRLELLTPLPGQAIPGGRDGSSDGSNDGSSDGSGDAPPVADERILSRVRMLLAKAESTTFEAEAATFTAGAQSLMARHSIDAALLARHDDARGRRSGPSGRRIGIDNPYDGPKASLLQAVASANRCRMVWSRELGFGTVVGFEADLEAVELLFTSLLVQATRTLAAAGSRTDPHGGSRTRSFRQSFLSAFAQRIGERLHEATVAEEESAVADGPSGRELVPLLAARAERVAEQVDEWFPDVRRTTVGAARDAEGWYSGRSAADRAQLGASPRLPGAGR